MQNQKHNFVLWPKWPEVIQALAARTWRLLVLCFVPPATMATWLLLGGSVGQVFCFFVVVLILHSCVQRNALNVSQTGTYRQYFWTIHSTKMFRQNCVKLRHLRLPILPTLSWGFAALCSEKSYKGRSCEKCLPDFQVASSNKKLLVTSASLLVTSALLVVTRSY